MKKLMIILIGVVIILSGCQMTAQQKIITQQQSEKLDQATKVMERTKVPTMTESLERQNIRNRLIISNDPNTLQWIYPMSAGRVIGRFPVKGKVTSGSKRMSSSEMLMPFSYDSSSGGGTTVEYHMAEAPDEMGTYGSSGDYIFWFDPAGRINQHKGDYFVSTVPYKIDLGYGTISTEIDQSEDSKRAVYEKQIQDTNKKQDETIAAQGGK